MRQVRTFAHLALAASFIIIAVSSCSDDSSPTRTNGDKNTWQKTYGGPWFDRGWEVVVTSDGGFLVTGESYVSNPLMGPANIDLYIVKMDAIGDVVWERTFGGDEYDLGVSLALTADGGCIVVGDTRSFGTGDWDIYLVKTDGSGNLIWEKTIGGAGDDGAYSIAPTRDGGYIIAGGTDSFGAGKDDVYLVKINSDGDTLWTRTYGGDGYEYGLGALQDADGGYVIVGATMSFGAGGQDGYWIKTDSLGDSVSATTFGGAGTDRPWSVTSTADSAYVIVGESDSYGARLSDVYIIKIDSRGNVRWANTLGGNGRDAGHSVIQTDDGGFILCGVTSSFGGDQGGDAYLVKTDGLGNVVWQKTFGGPFPDHVVSVAPTGDGGLVMVGGTQPDDSDWSDVYVIKTDANGNL